LTNDELMAGRCYRHRCDHSGELFVKPTYTSHWISCPYSELILVLWTFLLLFVIKVDAFT